ncbi:S41 family peptidase [Streptomyces sp. 549]|uniref:S41 family peptidase n=1 Tax=Streptomyces sp. 549 TaxID=3049076 RepID=UPI0024C214E4|nr:S41 family peptidase [Streptomyces sp. 549]MDK1473864.1 S41 family peptidase [Streptomyces sp. 549]
MSGPWMFVQPHRFRRGAALTLVFAGVLVTGFASGSWTGGAAQAGQGPEGSPISPRVVEEQHPADAHRLVSRSGDRWSAAYTAREYEGLQQELEGSYVGVGIAVRAGRDGRVEVARVTGGSPAERAGVRPGDRVHTVDGEDVTGLPVTEVVARLRGAEPQDAAPAAGETVVVGLGRDGRRWDEPLERAVLETESVTVRKLGQDVVRLRVESFTKGSGARVREALDELPERGGVLLDLRGNSGGLLHEAAAVASAFLDGGLVATYDDGGEQHALYAEAGGSQDVPLVVLVDGGTMSAAELLAGAFQDRGRAVVVGSRTFGKGSVQMPMEQPDGSVAELTVGHYATPAGRELEGQGLTPDVEVRAGQRVEDKARTVLGGLARRG